MTNFDIIAPVYDSLARIIFFGDILKSQCHYLNEIKPDQSVLILGGGSGKILESIIGINRIDFVEPSNKMLEIAKNRRLSIQVNFIKEYFEKFDSEKQYDVILCPFFLDLFEANQLESILSKVKTRLKKSGTLIITDFQIVGQSVWQQTLSKVMHLFFRRLTGLQSRSLQNIDAAIGSKGFVKMHETLFYRKFIFTRVYKLREIA